MRTQQKAFTLIELLIVVAIIAILAAIAVPNFLEAQTRAKVTRAKSDIVTCGRAIEAYRIDNNCIPWLGTYAGTYEYLRWTDYQTGKEAGIGYVLTTPISYISSIPIDVFNTNMSKKASPHGLPFFRVLNASFFYRGEDPKRGNKLDGTVAFPANEVAGVQSHNTWRGLTVVSYILSTCGPDLLPWPVTSPPDSIYRNMLYDPTNGTVSYGDIWYSDKLGLRGGGYN